MKKGRKINLIFTILGLLFLAFVVYVSAVYTASRGEPRFLAPPSESSEFSFLNISLVIAFMYLGIFSSNIFEKAKSSPDGKINLKSEVINMFYSSKFVMALVVSPLVFGSVYTVVGENPQDLGDFLLGFQNGFFWQSIVDGLAGANES